VASACTRHCTSLRTPGCAAGSSSGSSGPTSTVPPSEYRYDGPCSASPGAPVEFDVKTRTGRRSVDLDPTTITELDRWRRLLRLDGLPHGPDGWMFCNRKGRFLNPESLSHLFDWVVQRSELPRIRFHDLRHTHASLLVANGVPIKVVTERLGHSHPGFTMHTYQHVPGMSAAAAEQFATLVAAASR
jgi:integrase